MARGSRDGDYQTYYTDPRHGRPRAQVFADMDGWTDEVYEENADRHAAVTIYVVLPPLQLDGVRMRGILMTNAAELLAQRMPDLADMFVIIAYSMWASYAWSTGAEALCTYFASPEREAWFHQHAPARRQQLLLPLCDSDWVNEASLLPTGLACDIDILCVSRLDICKNLFMVARALKVLRRKHPERRLMMTLVTGSDVDLNWTTNNDHERNVLRQMTDELGHLPDYVHIIGKHDFFQMHALYSRARTYVLGSLLEGKNRGMLEAWCCNTPTVAFAEYNHHIRGPDAPLLPPGAGLLAPHFDAESLADTLWSALEAPERFTPRRAMLGCTGRRWTFNQILDRIPHVAAQMPDYAPGRHMDNAWLDAALARCYAQSTHGFVFSANPFVSHRMGLAVCLETLAFYRSRWG